MKNIIVFIVILILSVSCTVIAIEPYRTEDTLGPLHFRIGAGVELGQLAPNPSSSDTINDLGINFPLGIVYAGMGIWDNIDIYASAAMTVPSLALSGTIKYKFYDKLGFKMALTPTFKYSDGEGEAFSDSFSYVLMGGELPLAFTYSILGVVMLSAAPHAGYYNYEYDRGGVINSYDYYTYGATVTAEAKVGFLRVTLGVDGTKYYSSSHTLTFSDSQNLLNKNLYPYLTVSFQF